MALPSSGQISINDIRVELGASATNQSLRAFSNTAGFTTPDALSEFYGYSNLTSFSYFTGAALSLFSPPPLINKKYKGLNSIKAHKYLASLHFSAMLATNFFKNKNRKIHKYSAYTAVGSFAAAIMVCKF